MLMWEISSGQPSFINFNHDYELAIYIIDGIRPKIVPGTPLEYKNLMKQCWDADPSKRPDSCTLLGRLEQINLYDQNINIQSESFQPKANNDLKTNYTSRLFGSKVYQFENIPEPKNATEGIILYYLIINLFILKIYIK